MTTTTAGGDDSTVTQLLERAQHLTATERQHLIDELETITPRWQTHNVVTTLTTYLTNTGWNHDTHGPVGGLWRRNNHNVVVIADNLSADSYEFNGTLARIANGNNISVHALHDQLDNTVYN